ncbi:ras guanine nucleotide exchange factor domain-containing protein [Dichotomocladium elegans]|nr:ras guanine nucleotide exchange factor domain-containing protein [Dichotomocladium elegans]
MPSKIFSNVDTLVCSQWNACPSPKRLSHCTYTALANVYGVQEYSKANTFWKKLIRKTSFGSNNNGSNKKGQHQPTTERINTSPVVRKQKKVPALLKINTMLPDIPCVSKFNDLLIEDEHGTDIMFPSSPSSVILHSIRQQPSTASLAFSLSSTSLSSFSSEDDDDDDTCSSYRASYATNYPFTIFDALKSDEDERIIMWDYEWLSHNTSDAPEYQEHYSPESIQSQQRHTAKRRKLALSPVRLSFLNKKRHSNNQQHSFQSQFHEASSTPPTRQKVIKAATVEKLVEKLTSSLDYAFMTDFFLTFRSFITPTRLCQLLILRFRWALENDHEERRVVRIRTFVIMRHWLLNYYAQDFLHSEELRSMLLRFLNSISVHPLVCQSARDQRIVHRLKILVDQVRYDIPSTSSLSSSGRSSFDSDATLSRLYTNPEKRPTTATSTSISTSSSSSSPSSKSVRSSTPSQSRWKRLLIPSALRNHRHKESSNRDDAATPPSSPSSMSSRGTNVRRRGPIYLSHVVSQSTGLESETAVYLEVAEDEDIGERMTAGDPNDHSQSLLVESYESIVHPTVSRSTAFVESPAPVVISQPGSVLDHSARQIAEQCCLIERQLLSQVHWEELLECQWKTGGVYQIIQRFNTVSQWVAAEIVTTPVLEDRAHVIRKFIKIAHESRILANFATLFQILLALQSPSIARLHRTWAIVGASDMALLNQLCEFTSPFYNWKNIRQESMLIDHKGIIPFLGIYLSDLVFNHEQPDYLQPPPSPRNPSVLESVVLHQPQINFHKHRTTAGVIKRIINFQRLAEDHYRFPVQPALYRLCLDLPTVDPDAIRHVSLQIEPYQQ